MYSVGETFYYEIEDEEKELHVVGDVIIKGKEYIFTEDEYENYYVFRYDDISEELIYIDDGDEAERLIDEWQEEYYGTIDEVDLWEEEYNEGEEDEENIDDEEGFDYYIEDDFEDEEEFEDDDFYDDDEDK